MRRGSLRERVRAAAPELDKQDVGFEFGDLSDFLGVQTRQEEKSLRWAVQHLLKAGDLRRREDGRLGKVEHPPGAPTKQEIMWRFLRLNRRASVKKLMAVAQAAAGTVEQFGHLLQRRGLGKIANGEIYLIGNPGPQAPFDEERADRAKAWRQKQREALVSLDGAFATVAQECPGKNGESLRAIAAARMAVSRMEEG
ncbi:MAG: hypothetical protein ACYC6G_19025 [Desulfobaccales bacterium]